MSLYKRGNRYWTAFSVNGVPYRKPTGTAKKNDAKRRERELIAEAESGDLTTKRAAPKHLDDAITEYLKDYKIRCASRTHELEGELLRVVKKHFGEKALVSRITASAIANFQHVRKADQIGNRTINMNVWALSRLLRFCGYWKALAAHVTPLPEPKSLIGRVLTAEEKQRLIAAASANPEWEHVYYATVLSVNTSMRNKEVRHVQRKDVDLFKKVVTVSTSKTDAGVRRIPLNPNALEAMTRMIQRADALGFTKEEHYLWCACRWGKLDPEKPMTDWKTAWYSLREKAGLPGLRFHDLRHTFITEMAETPDISDLVFESIVGHLSKRMLEYYSEIRIEAKRRAIEKHFELQQEKPESKPEGTVVQ